MKGFIGPLFWVFGLVARNNGGPTKQPQHQSQTQIQFQSQSQSHFFTPHQLPPQPHFMPFYTPQTQPHMAFHTPPIQFPPQPHMQSQPTHNTPPFTQHSQHGGLPNAIEGAYPSSYG